MKVAKKTMRDRCRMAIAGIDKNLASAPTLSLDGAERTPAEVTQELGDYVEATNKTRAARAAWIDAVRDEEAKLAVARARLAALRTLVAMKYGNDAAASLGEFGFAPHKRGQKTVETKAAAIAKAAATRKARKTMGPRQRDAVKGQVTAIEVTPIVSAPAAPRKEP